MGSWMFGLIRVKTDQNKNNKQFVIDLHANGTSNRANKKNTKTAPRTASRYLLSIPIQQDIHVDQRMDTAHVGHFYM